MRPYQERVVQEKTELDSKLSKLVEFIDGPNFGAISTPERRRMLRQEDAMRIYSSILEERIRAF